MSTATPHSLVHGAATASRPQPHQLNDNSNSSNTTTTTNAATGQTTTNNSGSGSGSGNACPPTQYYFTTLEEALAAEAPYESLSVALRQQFTLLNYRDQTLRCAIALGKGYAELPSFLLGVGSGGDGPSAGGASGAAVPPPPSSSSSSSPPVVVAGYLQQQLITTEKRYYELMVAVGLERLQLYPYAHIRRVLYHTRETPLSYYLKMISLLLHSERSYDSLPNFTAVDVLQMLGVGRNQFLEITKEVRSKTKKWSLFGGRLGGGGSSSSAGGGMGGKSAAEIQKLLPQQTMVSSAVLDPFWTVVPVVGLSNDAVKRLLSASNTPLSTVAATSLTTKHVGGGDDDYSSSSSSKDSRFARKSDGGGAEEKKNDEKGGGGPSEEDLMKLYKFLCACEEAPDASSSSSSYPSSVDSLASPRGAKGGAVVPNTVDDGTLQLATAMVAAAASVVASASAATPSVGGAGAVAMGSAASSGLSTPRVGGGHYMYDPRGASSLVELHACSSPPPSSSANVTPVPSSLTNSHANTTNATSSSLPTSIFSRRPKKESSDSALLESPKKRGNDTKKGSSPVTSHASSAPPIGGGGFGETPRGRGHATAHCSGGENVASSSLAAAAATFPPLPRAPFDLC